MNKFRPSSAELKFRLWFSAAGLALLVVALGFRGLPTGPAGFEIVAIAGAFFGGTFVWSLRQLSAGRRDKDS